MQEGRGKESSQQQRTGQLPPLAPRDTHASSSTSSSTRDRPAASSSSSRSARLTHRSRAGCWTCRGRKVKCDEGRPKCGPCTRLNRECDWEHRWNFTDATSNIQGKYKNVTTVGNTVWDSSAQQSPSHSPSQEYDDLPVFAQLTNDEDRERKAELQRPGTYGVIATPDSFSELPEYATASSPTSRRMSVQSSRRGSLGSTLSMLSRSAALVDPNTVVLERFEEPSTTSSQSQSQSSPARGQSFSDSLQQMSISPPTSNSAQEGPATRSTAQTAKTRYTDEQIVQHFRRYIVRRLVQPLLDRSSEDTIILGSTRDIFEVEAVRFPPLHHAICAVSALHLSYNGRVQLEEAMQHYHQALSTSAAIATPDELISDGVFLRHYLLLIYDLCVPMAAEDGSTDMWADHLKNLRMIAVQRMQRLGREPFPYILYAICELDVRACLLGNGTCEFIQAMLQRDMLPPFEYQLPVLDPSMRGPFLPEERRFMPALLNLNQGVLIHTGKLAQLAQNLRAERSSAVSPDTHAQWHAAIAHLEGELLTFWSTQCPRPLHVEPEQVSFNLPPRARSIFERAFMLYHVGVIYARTSMYATQRLRTPISNNPNEAAAAHADLETRCTSILRLASAHIEAGMLECRHDIFPLLMAGYATTSSDAKSQAIDLAKAFEVSGGIGQNSYRTRQLLVAVCEEQRRAVMAGSRMEQVDWLTVARERGLNVVNCGL